MNSFLEDMIPGSNNGDIGANGHGKPYTNHTSPINGFSNPNNNTLNRVQSDEDANDSESSFEALETPQGLRNQRSTVSLRQSSIQSPTRSNNRKDSQNASRNNSFNVRSTTTKVPLRDDIVGARRISTPHNKRTRSSPYGKSDITQEDALIRSEKIISDDNAFSPSKPRGYLKTGTNSPLRKIDSPSRLKTTRVNFESLPIREVPSRAPLREAPLREAPIARSTITRSTHPTHPTHTRPTGSPNLTKPLSASTSIANEPSQSRQQSTQLPNQTIPRRTVETELSNPILSNQRLPETVPTSIPAIVPSASVRSTVAISTNSTNATAASTINTKRTQVPERDEAVKRLFQEPEQQEEFDTENEDYSAKITKPLIDSVTIRTTSPKFDKGLNNIASSVDMASLSTGVDKNSLQVAPSGIEMDIRQPMKVNIPMDNNLVDLGRESSDDNEVSLDEPDEILEELNTYSFRQRSPIAKQSEPTGEIRANGTNGVTSATRVNGATSVTRVNGATGVNGTALNGTRLNNPDLSSNSPRLSGTRINESNSRPKPTNGTPRANSKIFRNKTSPRAGHRMNLERYQTKSPPKKATSTPISKHYGRMENRYPELMNKGTLVESDNEPEPKRHRPSRLDEPWSDEKWCKLKRLVEERTLKTWDIIHSQIVQDQLDVCESDLEIRVKFLEQLQESAPMKKKSRKNIL